MENSNLAGTSYSKWLLIGLVVLALAVGSYFLAGSKLFKGELTLEQKADKELSLVEDYVELPTSNLYENFKAWPLEAGKETAFNVKSADADGTGGKPVFFWSDKGVGKWRALLADFDVEVNTTVASGTATGTVEVSLTDQSEAWGTSITQECIAFDGPAGATNLPDNCTKGAKYTEADLNDEPFTFDFTGQPAGEYRVSLVAYDGFGRVDVADKNFIIPDPATDPDPTPAEPVLAASCSAEVSDYEKVTFEDTSTITMPGKAPSTLDPGDWTWAWDFKDGETSYKQSPPAHLYPLKESQQEIAATLTLANKTDSNINAIATCTTVVIPELSVRASCPDVSVDSNGVATFTDKSTVYIGAENIGTADDTLWPWNWEWTFGDNKKDAENTKQNPTHTYDQTTEAQNMSVSYTVLNIDNPMIMDDVNGCMVTIPAKAAGPDVLEASFDHSSIEVTDDQEGGVIFYNKSIVKMTDAAIELTKVEWNFGDGTYEVLTSNDLTESNYNADDYIGDARKEFPFPAGNASDGEYEKTYHITLTVYDNKGNFASTSTDLTIKKPVKAAAKCWVTASASDTLSDTLSVKLLDKSVIEDGTILDEINLSYVILFNTNYATYTTTEENGLPMSAAKKLAASTHTTNFPDAPSKPHINYTVTHDSGITDQIVIDVLTQCTQPEPPIVITPNFTCDLREIGSQYSIEVIDGSSIDNENFKVETLSLLTGEGTVVFENTPKPLLGESSILGPYTIPNTTTALTYTATNKYLGSETIEMGLFEACASTPAPAPAGGPALPDGPVGPEVPIPDLGSSNTGIANKLFGSVLLADATGAGDAGAGGDGDGGAPEYTDEALAGTDAFDILLAKAGASVYFEARGCSRIFEAVHFIKYEDATGQLPAATEELATLITNISQPPTDVIRADLDINAGTGTECVAALIEDPAPDPIPTLALSCNTNQISGNPGNHSAVLEVKLENFPPEDGTAESYRYQWTTDGTAEGWQDGMPTSGLQPPIVLPAAEFPYTASLEIQQTNLAEGVEAIPPLNASTTCTIPAPVIPDPSLALSCAVVEKTGDPGKYGVTVTPSLQNFSAEKSYKHTWTVKGADQTEVTGLPAATAPLVLNESLAGDASYDVGLKITEVPAVAPAAGAATTWSTTTNTTCTIPAKAATPPTATPVIGFNAQPTSGFAPLAVQFTDQSQPLSGKPLTGLWTFGDGYTLAYNPNNDGTGKNPVHTYTSEGVYPVKLNLSDGTYTGQSSVTIVATKPEPQKPQCSDGKDNDGDGYIDLSGDPGCDSLLDNDEYNVKTVSVSACSDGFDNDKDGFVDLKDPGCENAGDNDEKNKEEVVIAGEAELPPCIMSVKPIDFTDIDDIVRDDILRKESAAAYDGRDDQFVGQRIFEGYPDVSGRVFRPFAAIRRDEAVKTALTTTCYMDHLDSENKLKKTAVNFKDEEFNDSDYWAADLIYIATHAGLVEGKTRFYPEANVTRAEFLKLLLEIYADSNNVKIPECKASKIKFVDVVDSDWFCKYAIMAKDLGITQGYKDGKGNFRLNPNKILTRNDAAVILWNYYIATTGKDFTGSKDGAKVVPR